MNHLLLGTLYKHMHSFTTNFREVGFISQFLFIFSSLVKTLKSLNMFVIKMYVTCPKLRFLC